MKLITKPISIQELITIAEQRFGTMTKAVVDIDLEIMVVDAELHVDQESFLLEKGSLQKNLWGINLYPDFFNEEDFIEFDSMINLRPSGGNNSRAVDDAKIREKITKIVYKLIT